MKLYFWLAAAITFLSIVNTILFWGTPAATGWICAFAGWASILFREE